MGKAIKAVAMMSGGLDSTLAAKLIKLQGIDVQGVNFFTGFCVTEHKRRVQVASDKPVARHEALRAGADLSIPVEIIDVHEDYFPVVANPKYGRGKAFNPCVDCRLFMFQRAKIYMEEIGAQFVITGEVQGQRPMTQYKNTLNFLAKASGLGDRLLRPLSARIMKPTLPEIEGWVDRESLLAISGRSRKEQIKLAEELGVLDYPQPAGGCCFLTDHNYTARFKDLFTSRDVADIVLDDVLLLKLGRHFRLNERVKIVVGRYEAENTFLSGYRARRMLLMPRIPGPTTLIDGQSVADEDVKLAAEIAARYMKPDLGQDVEFDVSSDGQSLGTFAVQPMTRENVERMRL